MMLLRGDDALTDSVCEAFGVGRRWGCLISSPWGGVVVTMYR